MHSLFFEFMYMCTADPVELLSAARRKHEHVKMRKVQHASHSTSAAGGIAWHHTAQAYKATLVTGTHPAGAFPQLSRTLLWCATLPMYVHT